jgi:serine/threonine protein kinase
VLDDGQYHELLERIVLADRFAATATTDANRHDDNTLTFSTGPTADGQTRVGAGSVLKNRFELDCMLGRGGMGIVFRAKDRIKIEAKDRSPYVALKIINEDFKAHPESFIALQRECSRTQKLAHPNIATVYDFDRTGGMAFMTMELLEGQPLNEFLATRLPDDGLPFDEAWRIIKPLGDALAFAHHRNMVHSDFKPANAFLTDSGDIKVLDFGIARAVKKPGQSDTTMFDAGKLGALTPTYASPEMLTGGPPDPRDDIYALGVVSYILLSSAHPYDRYPADMARKLELTPAPIGKLSKLQNQALRRALAFERDKRTATADEFLNELQGEFSAEQRLRRQSRLLVLTMAACALLVGCVIFLLMT